MASAVVCKFVPPSRNGIIGPGTRLWNYIQSYKGWLATFCRSLHATIQNHSKSAYFYYRVNVRHTWYCVTAFPRLHLMRSIAHFSLDVSCGKKIRCVQPLRQAKEQLCQLTES
ncbi:hypothetical protein J6590_023355 [Homalodisca vitripennis]|nr:hypothetical protein J6590_023355 [Homalodisca vitripennis]